MNKVEKYVKFFETLNKDINIDKYEEFFTKESRFKDPFHEVVGVDEIYQIFIKMYENLQKAKFKVYETIQEENIVYIKWKFIYKFKENSIEESFDGVSRVVFDNNGKIVEHIDYWDAAFNIYEKIPIIKSIIRYIKNRIKN